jgi:hypothetical protein
MATHLFAIKKPARVLNVEILQLARLVTGKA